MGNGVLCWIARWGLLRPQQRKVARLSVKMVASCWDWVLSGSNGGSDMWFRGVD